MASWQARVQWKGAAATQLPWLLPGGRAGLELPGFSFLRSKKYLCYQKQRLPKYCVILQLDLETLCSTNYSLLKIIIFYLGNGTKQSREQMGVQQEGWPRLPFLSWDRLVQLLISTVQLWCLSGPVLNFLHVSSPGIFTITMEAELWDSKENHRTPSHLEFSWDILILNSYLFSWNSDWTSCVLSSDPTGEVCVCVCMLSHLWLFFTPCSVAH